MCLVLRADGLHVAADLLVELGGSRLHAVQDAVVDLSHLAGHTGGQQNDEGQKNEHVGQEDQEPGQRSQAAVAQEVQEQGPQDGEHQLHEHKNKGGASDESDDDRNHR